MTNGGASGESQLAEVVKWANPITFYVDLSTRVVVILRHKTGHIVSIFMDELLILSLDLDKLYLHNSTPISSDVVILKQATRMSALFSKDLAASIFFFFLTSIVFLLFYFYLIYRISTCWIYTHPKRRSL
jgi:hypothetical protein